MTSSTLHPTPSFDAAVRQEIRAVAVAIRWEALFMALLLSVFSLMMALAYFHLLGNSGMRFDISPEIGLVGMVVGLLAPLAVWKGDNPERRGYFWSLPVGRTRHQLVKVGAGWLWLMVAMAIFLLWAYAAARLTGGRIGVSQESVFVGKDIRHAVREDFIHLTIRSPLWQWLAPFAGTTVMYLFASILLLLTDHPWRTALAIWLVGLLFIAVSDATHWEFGSHTMSTFFDNHYPYSLETAFTGSLRQREPFTGPNGVVHSDIERANLAAWLLASGIWIGIALLGTSAAAARHREP